MVWLQKYTNTLWRSCSPHLEHLTIICRPFYLPRLRRSSLRPFTYHLKLTRTWLWQKLTAWTNIQTLPSLWLGTLITQTSDGSCQTFFNMSPVQPEGKTVACSVSSPPMLQTIHHRSHAKEQQSLLFKWLSTCGSHIFDESFWDAY